MAQPAYRSLLRSISLAFASDARVALAARQQARSAFEQGAELDADGADAAERLAHAAEVAAVLRRNVVQAERVSAPTKDGHGQEERYRLRLHEHTERGDNDSVKNPDPEATNFAGCAREVPKVKR